MNEYEKYRLQWMLDHDYSLPDLLERLSDIAMNENLDEIQNPRVMLNEAFERLEYETVAEAMEEYYYNITKGGFYIPDRIKEGYMEEDYDNLSKEDIEL